MWLITHSVQKEWIAAGFFRFVRMTPSQILRQAKSDDKPYEPSWERLGGDNQIAPQKPNLQTLLSILQELIQDEEIHKDPIQYKQEPENHTYASNAHIPVRRMSDR